MKVLLGGVPFGCDNVGDEAILACVTRLFRERLPAVELTVATGDPHTAERLGVGVTTCWGFDARPLDGFDAVVRDFDAYVWCGATGLSDYPHVALGLLERARRVGVATFVWAVGMDDTLNPVFFRVGGLRRKLLSLVGCIGLYESFLMRRIHRRMRRTLASCRGVWLRDPQSAARLARSGFESARVTADTAVFQQPAAAPRIPSVAGMRTLGLCLSSQRPVRDEQGLKEFLSSVLAHRATRIVAIPMNPKTDRALMERLAAELGHPANFLMFDGDAPEDVTAQAGACDLVLSSRLHLLILAANAGTPIMGVARGSKLANWLANFGLEPVGSVADCDWRRLARSVIATLDDATSRAEFGRVRDRAYADLHARFETAADEMFVILKGISDDRN